MTETEPMWLLDLRPPVPTRYVRRSFRDRLRTSPAAIHLRAATRSAFWPLAIGAGLVLAFTALAWLQALTPVGAIR